MRAITLLAVLALAACATPAGFDARMQGFVGVTEGDLVQQIGVPDGDFTTPDGRRFLQYERLGVASPAPAPVMGLGVGGFGWRGGFGSGVGIGAAYPVVALPPPCSVTFEVRAARVASFSRRGSGCVASAPD
ncbi:hypothetical protein [Roseomonas sp. CECT 9278]|uniref:hypothetical protein n=1 Tax=Roseomonas sp. CECT 9278 TaxID=2845823 RepID=UPI001E64BD26|nr:hypothetical protein [Roseomonas sp. CECT 9278]CAH0222023.1 hypothetical protein ROS9278_02434 [Roseomonas sp. CECT 9278]